MFDKVHEAVRKAEGLGAVLLCVLESEALYVVKDAATEFLQIEMESLAADLKDVEDELRNKVR